MRTFHNIETRKVNGYKIAYSADGRSWCITGKTGFYCAHANLTRAGSVNMIIGAAYLSELSSDLERIK